MKKIIASVMALLMICSSQTSALNKESTVKKVVYNVCTKVLPIAAVTLGAGFLVKKLVIDRENNVSAQQQAYDDGIRYIKWHDNMCWLNASILYLYYNNFYRDFLCNLEETTYENVDDIKKKIIIALANLVKKIKNSETCMCELSKQEYESVLSLYREYDSTHRANYEFGKSNNQLAISFISLIDAYIDSEVKNRNDEGIRVVYEGIAFMDKKISMGHYYNLYYSKKTNRLYSIGKSILSNLNSSVCVVEPKNKLYRWFKEKDSSKMIYKVTCLSIKSLIMKFKI